MKNYLLIYFVIVFVFLHINVQETKSGTAEIPETTKVLDKNSLETIVSQNENEIVFSKMTPLLKSINEGDIIVGGVSVATPYGLAPQKVKRIKKRGQGVIIITEKATLAESIKNVKGSIKVKMTSESPVKVKLKEGVSFKQLQNKKYPDTSSYPKRGTDKPTSPSSVPKNTFIYEKENTVDSTSEAHDKNEITTESKKRAKLLFEKGMKYYNKRDYGNAMLTFREALNNDPKHKKAEEMRKKCIQNIMNPKRK